MTRILPFPGGLPDEPERDPEIATALRAAGLASPTHAVDWAALRGRIVNAAAAGPLSGTGQRMWWQYTVGWARGLVPAGIAAAIVAAALVWSMPAQPALLDVAVAPASDQAFGALVGGARGEQPMLDALVALPSAESLLSGER